MQKVMLAGRVGNVKQSQINGSNGTVTVLNISLACKSDKKGSDGKFLTDWWDCSLWGKYAESMTPYISKGASISVIGKPSVSSYEKDGQTHLKQMCKIDDLTLIGGGDQQAQQQQQPQQQQYQPQQQQYQPQQQQYQPQQQPQQQQQSQYAPSGFDIGDDVPFSNYELRTLA